MTDINPTEYLPNKFMCRRAIISTYLYVPTDTWTETKAC